MFYSPFQYNINSFFYIRIQTPNSFESEYIQYQDIDELDDEDLEDDN